MGSDPDPWLKEQLEAVRQHLHTLANSMNTMSNRGLLTDAKVEKAREVLDDVVERLERIERRIDWMEED